MILEAFTNFNDSVILCHMWEQQHIQMYRKCNPFPIQKSQQTEIPVRYHQKHRKKNSQEYFMFWTLFRYVLWYNQVSKCDPE